MPSEHQHLCIPPHETVDVFSEGCFQIRIANQSSSVIYFAKHRVVAIVSPPFSGILYCKNDESSFFSMSHHLSKTMSVLHSRPTRDGLQQFHPHDIFEKHDVNHLKNDWPENMTIAYRYKKNILISEGVRRYRRRTEWPARTENNFKAHNFTTLWGLTARSKCRLPAQTSDQTIHHKQNGQDTERRHHRIRPNRVGKSNHLCSESTVRSNL